MHWGERREKLKERKRYVASVVLVVVVVNRFLTDVGLKTIQRVGKGWQLKRSQG